MTSRQQNFHATSSKILPPVVACFVNLRDAHKSSIILPMAPKSLGVCRHQILIAPVYFQVYVILYQHSLKWHVYLGSAYSQLLRSPNFLSMVLKKTGVAP